MKYYFTLCSGRIYTQIQGYLYNKHPKLFHRQDKIVNAASSQSDEDIFHTVSGKSVNIINAIKSIVPFPSLVDSISNHTHTYDL